MKMNFEIWYFDMKHELLWKVKALTGVKNVNGGCQGDRSRHKAYSLSVSIPLWQLWTLWRIQNEYDDLEAIIESKKMNDDEIALTFGSELKWLKQELYRD